MFVGRVSGTEEAAGGKRSVPPQGLNEIDQSGACDVGLPAWNRRKRDAWFPGQQLSIAPIRHLTKTVEKPRVPGRSESGVRGRAPRWLMTPA